jgi:hypothetical protein
MYSIFEKSKEAKCFFILIVLDAFDYGGVRTNNKKENGYNSNQIESTNNRKITTIKETHW